MRTACLLSLVLATAAYAGPATQPAPHFEPAPLVGQAVDASKPAFVPKFAKLDNPPVGRFAERDYAYRYTYAAPFLYGYGYGGFGYGSYGFSYGGLGYGAFGFGGPGSWGSTQVPFR